jgi:hypothetical protein
MAALPCGVPASLRLAAATVGAGLTQAEVTEDDQYDDNDPNDVKDVHAFLRTERAVQGRCQESEHSTRRT